VGDILGAAAQEHLEILAPYPGDPTNGTPDLVSRFRVTKVSERSHLILDELRQTDALIETDKLADPSFRLAQWYARRCIPQGPRRRRRRLPSRYRLVCMGNALAEGAETILERGEPFPGDENHVQLGGRFQVIP
ncbi:hypothetical protein FPV67DRAFT_1401053, partial [Lyophyllum atratum]